MLWDVSAVAVDERTAVEERTIHREDVDQHAVGRHFEYGSVRWDVLQDLASWWKLQRHRMHPSVDDQTRHHHSHEARARTAFEPARAQQEKIVQAQPEYGPPLCVLGVIDAALGRKEAALQEGRRAIELLPVEKDYIDGNHMIQYFAITAAWAGAKDIALEQLEISVRTTAPKPVVSYGELKLMPFWDPLRGDPRFEKIVASLAAK